LDKANEDSGTTAVYEPDYSLKETIGVSVPLESIFTPERIAAGNKVIEDRRNDFFTIAEGEIKKLSALISGVAKNSSSFFSDVAEIATSMKGEGEMFGYPLIQEICMHIIETCHTTRENSATQIPLIRDLAQALHYAVKNKIKDDGGIAGQTLLADLSRYRSTTKPLAKSK
jgi:hypothetical protein